MKICFRCKKGIKPEEHYYSFTEFKDKKIVNVNYAHKKCWDDFLEKLTTLKKAQSLLGRMEGGLEKMGLLPKEQKEVIIDG